MVLTFQQHTHKLRLLGIQVFKHPLFNPPLEISHSQLFIRTQNPACCLFCFLLLSTCPASFSSPDSSLLLPTPILINFLQGLFGWCVSLSFQTLPPKRSYAHQGLLLKTNSSVEKALRGPSVKTQIVSPTTGKKDL